MISLCATGLYLFVPWLKKEKQELFEDLLEKRFQFFELKLRLTEFYNT